MREEEGKRERIRKGGRGEGKKRKKIKEQGRRSGTRLACFNLSGAGQCLDLHSSVVLDFEEGKTDQVRIGAFPNPGTLFQAPL